jgi:dihydrolipoamide dehydrogenase
MSKAENKAQVVVIGGGPGGYGAAFMAADLGMNVTLVDPETNPGGVCLYRGCIPSKALLHVADVIHSASQAKEWGVTFQKPQIDAKKVAQWKDDVVKKLTGGLGQLAKSRKVNHIKGIATFKDAHTLKIESDDGPDELEFEHAILATGSVPASLPGVEFSERVWSSEHALNLPFIPDHLLIVGAGYIGLEMGTAYSALGSGVTVVEMLPDILAGADRDLVRPLEKRLKKEFDDIHLNTRVKAIRDEDKLWVDLEDKSLQVDAVLISVGRKPNTQNLGLENTKISLDDKGFVRVNAQRRTDEESIFAIGDVTGEPLLAHKATHEGRVAAQAIAGHKAAFDPHAIPAVVFTDPEVAWAGLTEHDAKEQGIEVEIAKFPWGASGRALTMGRQDGVTKLVIDPASERILGVGITGKHAGDMIAEGVLAIEMAALVSDLGLSIHPHPTLSETVMEAADVYEGTSTHYYRPRKK